MVKNHMKRLRAPPTWKIHRKDKKFITKPNPGAHVQLLGTSINTFLKELVHVTKTTKETKYLLTKQEVLVNGNRVRDDKFMVGLFDVIKIPSVSKSFRVIMSTAGNLSSKELKSQDNEILLKVTGKTVLKKDKVQINTMSGRNILAKKKDASSYKTGDTLVVTVPENKIKSHIAREKGVHVFIFIGKHVGKQGTLEEIQTRTATIKVGNDKIETNKNYVFVTGKTKPELEVA